MSGIVKPIRMVKPQAIHLTFCHQTENQPVRRFEDFLILHTNAGEIVGVEKAPVVDVVGGHPPIGQPKRLRFNQFVKFFETCGIGGVSVDRVDGSNDAGRDLGGPRTQLG